MDRRQFNTQIKEKNKSLIVETKYGYETNKALSDVLSFGGDYRSLCAILAAQIDQLCILLLEVDKNKTVVSFTSGKGKIITEIN